MRTAWFLVLAAGCGRFGFTENSADGSYVIDGTKLDEGTAQACTTAVLCDGFEGSDVDSTWTKSGAVSVDNTFAHNGSQSVHMLIGPIAAGGMIEARLINTTLLASTPGPLWVRAWIKLGSLPAGGNHMELICTEQQTPPNYGDCVFLYSNETALYTQFSNAVMQGQAPPVLPWFCFVWQIERSTTAGAMRLTSDVIPTIELLDQPTNSTTNPVDALTIGGAFYSANTPTAQPALDVWFDDLIVSTSPVTCDD